MKVTAIDRRAIPPGASIRAWQAPDGWKLRRLDWPQAGGEPRGSLIFANGRGDFIEKYLEPLAHWHDRGWNVASFDWRGQGNSRGSIKGGHVDSFDPLVADGAALLKDWMAANPGPHVAIGHSMGGHLLLRILAEQRPALAAAVLVAPMIGINAAPLSPWAAHAIAQGFCTIGWNRVPAWKDGDRRARLGPSRQQFLTSSGERYSDESFWLGQEPGFALGAPSWGWLVAAYRSMAILSDEKLRRVETPILLLGTERDRLVSAAAIRQAAGLLPRAELKMFDDAGHEILREADPVRLEALEGIDRFMDEHAAA